MTRINPLRLGRMVTTLAGTLILFLCTVMMSNVAHAQASPPCNNFWIDTDIPGVIATLNWTPLGTTPTSTAVPVGSNFYSTAPGPGTLNSFSFTLPCGSTIGPFNGPWGSAPVSPGFCVPDPCNPGQCIYVRAYMLGAPPSGCPYELQVLNGTNLCPGGCK
ncbi:MAG: hypothetical protein ABIR47_01405 [Candidatus Kapaibacterium sp.]